jgi:hypothetical protein
MIRSIKWERISFNYLSFELMVILFLFITINLNAKISWEETSIGLFPSITNENVTGTYRFTNSGAYPVEFVSVKTSCGCTTTKLDKELYSPGEVGVISATYTIENRFGLQQKKILVQTTDKTNPITELLLNIHIPEIATFVPSLLNWNLHEAPNTKTIKITLDPKLKISILNTQSTNEILFAKLKMIKFCEEYEVSITPQNTEFPAHSILSIESSLPMPRKYIHLHAAIGG